MAAFGAIRQFRHFSGNRPEVLLPSAFFRPGRVMTTLGTLDVLEITKLPDAKQDKAEHKHCQTCSYQPCNIHDATDSHDKNCNRQRDFTHQVEAKYPRLAHSNNPSVSIFVVSFGHRALTR
jgi:hypothetical protein